MLFSLVLKSHFYDLWFLCLVKVITYMILLNMRILTKDYILYLGPYQLIGKYHEETDQFMLFLTSFSFKMYVFYY